jgi:hypothetical protein
MLLLLLLVALQRRDCPHLLDSSCYSHQRSVLVKPHGASLFTGSRMTSSSAVLSSAQAWPVISLTQWGSGRTLPMWQHH